MIFILQLRIITLYMVERGNVFSGHNLNYSIQETFLKILMALAQKFCVIYSFFVILTAHTHEVLHECRKREHSLRTISFIHILTYFSLHGFSIKAFILILIVQDYMNWIEMNLGNWDAGYTTITTTILHTFTSKTSSQIN